MALHNVIESQYLASLDMLRQAVVACPESLWNSPDTRNKFWHISYHALFYTHLYLSPTERDFTAWDRHREEYEFMGPLPWPPHKEPQIGEPYDPVDILDFLDYCVIAVKEIVPTLDFDAPSGFSWLPFGKLELQFYNIRHLQQHIGELCERLGETAGINVNWVGTRE